MDIAHRLGGGTTFTTPSDREIVVTRVLDAPRRLVFDAWTSPEHIPHWMGPKAWTMRVCEIDLRPGGGYRFAWSGPDGAEMGISGVYRVIDPPGRLVTTESWDEGPEVLNTLVLNEQDGVTTMTCTALYPSRDVRDAVLGTGMRAGMSEGLNRLEERLRARAGSSEGKTTVDWKLEAVPLPVTDVDRAKHFYGEMAGFTVDHDHRIGEDFRVLQLTPPGSACSIVVGTGIVATEPGSVQGLTLVVPDIHAARAELTGRGVEVSEVEDLTAPGKPTVSHAYFSDPDGNGWVLQQRIHFPG
ncbi:hypothetical protein Skr01_11660 [Sphaerisporangium krabiense]|uniref:Uncharacterized protein YndB with AHSA1/START domain/catechol 2,3-dioxygenase-like lactoylglutathione lyase family enzyme n=1 Tax=Sphaerisporangium krabiense TaxID=763782 RepID=A0A7W8ZD43_9ACTN|nr:SRPBCC domain-containing protein [Sphaerisporangium krabiense]MBB5631665.1 uncharacterized protein YndB with AHSA1/START domain/catechol 2,3-dioxygenase-like lactoylglutathione lyase family enzyme [Sphaerisporangium krabiense]GII61081.1 hypothetical protein Skr01_11660 [Sphaerisporangium krabiense]